MQCSAVQCSAAEISGCSWDKGDGPVRGAAAAAAAGAAAAAEVEEGLGLFF